jgi:hypothetical protein
VSRDKAIQQAKGLLKAAKENPEQFQELGKAIPKEEQARRKSMASAAHHEKWKRNIGPDKHGGNFITNNDPNRSHHFGINHQDPRRPAGQSSMGTKVREPAQYMSSAKEDAADRLAHMKQAPKPNLPKAEMEKGEKGKQKGVHEAHFGASHKTGTSSVGAHMAPGGASAKTNAWAKEQHKDKLAELKEMPKPNLPKAEKEMEKTSEMGLALSEVKKDDMPHAPNSPQDKAHDVSEHADTIGHAMKILDTPERQRAMLAHLRTLHDPSQARSEENKEAGMSADEKKPMNKAEIIKAAKDLIDLAKNEPAKFEELTKAMAAPAPAPAAPKPAMAAPKMPAKPAGIRMSKEEIKEDLKKPWEPKKSKKMEGR